MKPKSAVKPITSVNQKKVNTGSALPIQSYYYRVFSRFELAKPNDTEGYDKYRIRLGTLDKAMLDDFAYIQAREHNKEFLRNVKMYWTAFCSLVKAFEIINDDDKQSALETFSSNLEDVCFNVGRVMIGCGIEMNNQIRNTVLKAFLALNLDLDQLEEEVDDGKYPHANTNTLAAIRFLKAFQLKSLETR